MKHLFSFSQNIVTNTLSQKIPLFLTMRFYLVLLLLFAPLLLLAQGGTITGKVARLDSKTKLARASVFLSNSSYGTSTNDDGTFTLNNVKPGQYELVVSMVGFEDFNQTIMVGKEPITINAELMPKITQLHEVVISTPADWKKNYDMFVKAFLGESENARKCKILNPHTVNMVYHKARQSLEAWSNDFIEIENKALGYKVKFMLKSFNCDYADNIISWEGKVLYTELPGTAVQKKLWEAKRNDIYYGSAMHFFRSLQNAKLNEDGFLVMILLRKPNPERPPQALIQKKLAEYQYALMTRNNIDSANYWRDKYNLPRYIESLVRQPLKETNIARATNQPGVFMISFQQYLYVMYTKKREDVFFKDIYHPLDMPNYQTSVLTLYQPYALFDMNGSVISSHSTLFEGTWSKDKVAELLPIDYVPGELVLKDDLKY
jgi:hypothetical protein